MRSMRPSKRRRSNPVTVKSTRAATFTSPSRAAGIDASNWSRAGSITVNRAAPGATTSPSDTCRCATTPAKGARTRALPACSSERVTRAPASAACARAASSAASACSACCGASAPASESVRARFAFASATWSAFRAAASPDRAASRDCWSATSSIRASSCPAETRCPASASTWSTAPPTSARSAASRFARSVPEISGPEESPRSSTTATFSAVSVTGGCSAGAPLAAAGAASRLQPASAREAASTAAAQRGPALRLVRSTQVLPSLVAPTAPNAAPLYAAWAQASRKPGWGLHLAFEARRTPRTALGQRSALELLSVCG